MWFVKFNVQDISVFQDVRQISFLKADYNGASKNTGAVFSYKLRYIVGFRLVEIAISTNQKPTIYRNLYENTGPDS